MESLQWRRRPEIADFCPLSWSNLSWCIRPGVNTCAACICTEINSPKKILCISTRDVRIQALYQYRGHRGQSANTYFKNNSSKIYFPVFALMRIQAPHVFAQKLIPQEFFPACIGFVPGGRFRGNSQSRSNSRSGSRFSSLPLHENLLPDLLFDLLWEFSPNPTLLPTKTLPN